MPIMFTEAELQPAANESLLVRSSGKLPVRQLPGTTNLGQPVVPAEKQPIRISERDLFYQLPLLIRQAIWSTVYQLVQAEGVGSFVPGRKLWARRNQKPRLTSTQAPTTKLRCLRCPGPSPFLQKLPLPGSCLHQCPVQYLLVYQFLPCPFSQRNKSCFINLDESESCRG